MARTDRDDVLLPKKPLAHWGRWVAGLAIILVVVWFIAAASNGMIEYDQIPGITIQGIMLEGLRDTILLAVFSQLIGIAIGLIMALLRVSKNPVARTVAGFYIWMFRALPALLQVMIWYNLSLVFPMFIVGIPLTGVVFYSAPMNTIISTFTASLLGLGLNEGAYMAEIIRNGIASVGDDQIEAAKSIGMTPRRIMTRVVLPQAIRVIIPPTGNDFIGILKATSICSAIGYMELLHAANNLSSHSLLVLESLFAASIWYLLLVSIATVIQSRVEQRLNHERHDVRPLSSRVLRSILAKREITETQS